MVYKGSRFLRIYICGGIKKIDPCAPNSGTLSFFSKDQLSPWDLANLAKFLSYKDSVFVGTVIWEGSQEIVPAELNIAYQFKMSKYCQSDDFSGRKVDRSEHFVKFIKTSQKLRTTGWTRNTWAVITRTYRGMATQASIDIIKNGCLLSPSEPYIRPHKLNTLHHKRCKL